MFDIRFIVPSEPLAGPLARGEIAIGPFREQFEIVLEYWDQSQYERQWREGIKRIVDGNEVSCLITSMINPERANFIFWWPLYRVGETCVFHNQILFMEQLVNPFNASQPYESVRPRERSSDDGETVSEWSIPIRELSQWNQQF